MTTPCSCAADEDRRRVLLPTTISEPVTPGLVSPRSTAASSTDFSIGSPKGQDNDTGSHDRRKGSGFMPYHSKSVPKPINLEASEHDPDAPITTLMLRNIPNKYTQNALMQEINGMGFSGTFDFFYLPMDIHNRSNVGYAFINFLVSEEAHRFRSSFVGHEFQRFRSRKVGTVCDAHLQGLAANIRHFQHRAVSMSRNDQYRPAVLRGNQRVKFEDAVAEVEAELQSAVPQVAPIATPPGLPECEVEWSSCARTGDENPRTDLEAAIRVLLKKSCAEKAQEPSIQPPAPVKDVSHKLVSEAVNASQDIEQLIALKNLLSHRLLESQTNAQLKAVLLQAGLPRDDGTRFF